MFGAFRGGPDWILETHDASDYLDKWRADVLAHGTQQKLDHWLSRWVIYMQSSLTWYNHYQECIIEIQEAYHRQNLEEQI